MDDFTLFKWQRKAIDESVQRASYGLFADPGTGKTYCAIRIAQNWTRHAVVICPLSVKPQWEKEAVRMDYKLFIFHYEQLRQKTTFDSIEKVLRSEAVTLIVDESHRIKSPITQVTKAVLKLAAVAARRLALTGTPTANSPADLYTQLKFLKPHDKMESYRDFQETYIESLPASHPLMKRIAGSPFIPKKSKTGSLVLKNIDKLVARVQELGITVNLEDVTELPERTFIVRSCKASPELTKIYKQLKEKMYAQFADKEITAANAAVLVGRLMRLTSGLGHADFEVSLPNPKLKELLNDISIYTDVGKVIVWTVWADERREVYDHLKMLGYKVATEPNDFIEGGADILVASPKMFGTGLNLQTAMYQLWLSRGYSLLEREQALARNYRAGQDKKTVVVDYVVQDTIDERVLVALENKTDLLNQIMQTGEL